MRLRAPSLDKARRDFEDAQRREFRKILPAKIDVSVYDYDRAMSIHTSITIEADGTWRES